MIKKRFMHGHIVELNIYGSPQEIEWELNGLYNTGALERPVEVDEPCTIVYVDKARWIESLKTRMLFSMDTVTLDASKGKRGGIKDLIDAKVAAYIAAMPDETAPIKNDLIIQPYQVREWIDDTAEE